jgi:7-carboxy-7-deazaguanine synthase
MLEVSEIFPSLQGEGVFIGIPMTFIRLSKCNLSCEFCDTKYSWQPGMHIEEEKIAEQVNSYPAHWVCITGGEPLLQNLSYLFGLLPGKSIMIETNGTIFDQYTFEAINFASVSPKFQDIKLDVLLNIYRAAEHMQLKFVIDNDRDVLSAYNLIHKLSTHLPIKSIPIVLQPNGSVPLEKYFENLRNLWEIIQDTSWKAYDIRVIPQIHRILFGMKKGI